jgi:hypothetical protein
MEDTGEVSGIGEQSPRAARCPRHVPLRHTKVRAGFISRWVMPMHGSMKKPSPTSTAVAAMLLMTTFVGLDVLRGPSDSAQSPAKPISQPVAPTPAPTQVPLVADVDPDAMSGSDERAMQRSFTAIEDACTMMQDGESKAEYGHSERERRRGWDMQRKGLNRVGKPMDNLITMMSEMPEATYSEGTLREVVLDAADVVNLDCGLPDVSDSLTASVERADRGF